MTRLLATGTFAAVIAASVGPVGAAAGGEPILEPLGQAPNDCAELNSVVAFSATNASAVGGVICTAPTAPLIEHWGGQLVTKVHAPGFGDEGYEEYFGVAAAGPSNIWAVGADSFDGEAGGDIGLIARWNGTTWRLVAGPTGQHFESWLNEVRLAPNGDAWMAGEVGNRAALVRVHDEKNTVIKLPAAGNLLYGLYLASATDIWAGGGGYFVHGDGTHWKVLAAPGGVGVRRIAGSSPSNIWAIADTPTGSALLHFDGRKWITTATSGAGGPYLAGLSVRGTDMWLSGSEEINSHSVPYVAHFNGQSLATITVSLPPGAIDAVVNGVTAYAHGLFAVGQVFNTGFQGTQWWSTSG